MKNYIKHNNQEKTGKAISMSDKTDLKAKKKKTEPVIAWMTNTRRMFPCSFIQLLSICYTPVIMGIDSEVQKIWDMIHRERIVW